MAADNCPQAAGVMGESVPDSHDDPQADSRDESPSPMPVRDTATARMQAFLRSGKHRPAEVMDVYSGDYAFTPLGDTVTADMRHQRERLCERAPSESKAAAESPSAPNPLPEDSDVKESRDGGRPVQGSPFVTLMESLCLHRHGRHEGCRRCIESCSSGALQPGTLYPLIDPALCQGCGLCTGVCPSGALHWRPLPVDGLLERMREAMSPWISQGAAPLVVFHDRSFDETEALSQYTGALVHMELATLGMVGMDVLLSAMALGASGVILLTASRNGDAGHARIAEEVRWSQAVVQALGFDPACILIGPADEAAIIPAPIGRAVPPAKHPFDLPKRTRIRLAIEHLADHNRNRPIDASLTAGAPFGGVSIDTAACTLCMACAGACKMKALGPMGRNTPGLQFTEMQCVQCGLCVRVCPEQALQLLPRLNPDAVGSRSPVTLHQVAPARCISCGTAFASQRMIAAIQAKLQDHWMYTGVRAQKRLSMCDRCRVQDLFFNPPPTKD